MLNPFGAFCLRLHDKQENSASRQRLEALTSLLAVGQLGQFSRILGKVIESISDTSIFHILLPRLLRLETLAETVNLDWAACRWAELVGLEGFHPETRKHDEPWKHLKTLLFTLTMIYSSLMSLVNSLSLSPTRHPADIISDLAACSLRTFSAIHFITTRFGTNTFGAYKVVWYGALGVIARGHPTKVEQTVRDIEPNFSSDSIQIQIMKKRVNRSKTTFYLDAVEQLVAVLSDEYIEEVVLVIAKP